tara:strand:- start:1358 stop:2452 length:1095 start_codon:yes stop_codon:yes gene_type:complete
MKNKKEAYYSEYLQLDKILSSQELKSKTLKEPIHDELLFIITHQAYELWFKQIIHEIDSIIDLFKESYIEENNLSIIVNRLNRVAMIQELLINQIKILESMTPMDFLEFRNLLSPASGFQSLQFRIIENKLGLIRENRLKFSKEPYDSYLNKQDRDGAKKSEKENLFSFIEKWLERTPFIKSENFDFWKEYKTSVDRMLKEDIQVIKNNSNLSEEAKKKNLIHYDKIYENYSIIFDVNEYNKLLKTGAKRFSQKACLASLFIMLYREQPILDLPYRIITKLIDIDNLMNKWRYGHASLAQRMIGAKIGTGGSSGHSYLRKTLEKHKIFDDLTNLSTYLIPRSSLPKLPEELKNKLGYYFNYDKK